MEKIACSGLYVSFTYRCGGKSQVVDLLFTFAENIAKLITGILETLLKLTVKVGFYCVISPTTRRQARYGERIR